MVEISPVAVKRLAQAGKKAAQSLPLKGIGERVALGKPLTAEQMQFILAHPIEYTKDEIRILKQMTISARQAGVIDSIQFANTMKILDGKPATAEDIVRSVARNQQGMDQVFNFGLTNAGNLSTKDANTLMNLLTRVLEGVAK